MDSLWEIFTSDYMRNLENMAYYLNSHGNSGFTGSRKSNAQGSGLDFSDYRNYAFGDDIRRIDWKSYARLDKLYIKIFEQERQALINIFIDCSKSMDYGENNKHQYAKALALSLTYLLLNQSDRIHIFTFDEKLVLTKQSLVHKDLFPALIDQMDLVEAEGETNFLLSFQDFIKYRKGSGHVFIFSDFLTEEDFFRAIRKLQYGRQEISMIQVLSREELNPSFSGAIRLKALENQMQMDFEMTPEVIQGYLHQLNLYLKNIEKFCMKNRIPYILAPTDRPLFEILSKL